MYNSFSVQSCKMQTTIIVVMEICRISNLLMLKHCQLIVSLFITKDIIRLTSKFSFSWRMVNVNYITHPSIYQGTDTWSIGRPGLF